MADYRVVDRPILAIVPTFLRDTQPTSSAGAGESEIEVLLKCLISLRATAPAAQVVLIDDHSPDPALAALAEQAAAELGMAFVRKDENSGFAATVNVGLAYALEAGMDALLVNADMEFVQAGWLERMVARRDTLDRPAAVVGARLLYPNGLLQHAGVYFSPIRREFAHRFQYGPADLPEAQLPCRCPVTGALQLIRHETLATIGIYDAGFGLGHEDMDYCLRTFEAGLECIYEPSAVALHHESLFRGKASSAIAAMARRSALYLREKHGATDMTPWTPKVL